MLVVNAVRARRPTSPISPRGCPSGVRLMRADAPRRCSPCRGRRRPRSWHATARGCADMPFMSAPRSHPSLRRHRPATSRAPATPARTASRSPSRAKRRRSAGRRAARRARGEADRPRRARFAAARGGALPLRPRHRHDDVARRGRRSSGRSASAGARRAASPAPSASAASWPRAPPRMRVGLLPEGRAPAREGAESSPRRTAAPSASSPPAASAPASTARSPWAMSRPRCARPARNSHLHRARQGRCPRRVVPLPFVPHRYARRLIPDPSPQEQSMAETRYTKDHEYIRIDGDIGTVGITDYAQSQLGDVVFVELPEVGKARRQGRRGGRRRERQGGERGLRPGLRRGRRGQRRPRGHARHRQRGPARARAGS